MTVVMREIPEHLSEDGGRLGRHVKHDPKSKDFPAEAAPKIITVHHSFKGLPLNQTRGSCTAEAFCGASNTVPDSANAVKLFNQVDADSLYDQEIILEGGNPATDDPGGTGLMVCKAAKKNGWVKSYSHAFGLQHSLQALVIRPVMFGVNWYEGFDRPDAKGIVKIAGQIRGGHEFVGVGILVAQRLIECVQSWGPWGYKGTGKFYVPYDQMDRLLGEQGDCTVPIV